MKSKLKITIISILLAGCDNQGSNIQNSKALDLYKEETCITCHSLDGAEKMGPSLKGIYGKKVKVRLGDGSLVTLIRDDEYLRDAILNPKLHIVDKYMDVMNGFSHLSDTEIEILINFIKDLK